MAFFDCDGILHKEFVPQDRIVSTQFYTGVLRCLMGDTRKKTGSLVGAFRGGFCVMTSGTLRTGFCIMTLCQPDLHNDCFAFNTVLTTFNIAAHSDNRYNTQHPHPNFQTPRSMNISSYTIQLPHLSVLPTTILPEQYFVFGVEVKQTTYTIRSFHNPTITQLLLTLLWLELNECTYMQH
jgi:hypothetical protein